MNENQKTISIKDLINILDVLEKNKVLPLTSIEEFILYRFDNDDDMIIEYNPSTQKWTTTLKNRQTDEKRKGEETNFDNIDDLVIDIHDEIFNYNLKDVIYDTIKNSELCAFVIKMFMEKVIILYEKKDDNYFNKENKIKIEKFMKTIDCM